MGELEDKIKKGIETRKPKPYWQFLGVDITKELLVMAGWIVSVFLLGAIVYIIANFNALPPLPRATPYHYLRSFLGLPWELIVVFVLVVVGVYLLSKKISTLYRKPYVLVIIIVVSLAGGYFVAEASGINEYIANRTAARRIYERQGRFLPGRRGLVTIGKITKVEEGNIMMDDPTGKTWTVKINDDTKTGADLKSGAIVSVIGPRNDSTIEAIGITDEIPRRGFCQGSYCPPPRLMPR
ncbi:MAG: hypothetical protein OEV37_00550 [Candidatus Berkelbacteria bacterium]|nr:hypothetical protein [Candidatus Berkelbacteria bacterium]